MINPLVQAEAIAAPGLAPPATVVDDLRRATRQSRHWLGRWAGRTISLSILLACLFQLYGLDRVRILPAVPTSPMFWAAIAIFYASLPACEWVIFRVLWGLPPGGIFPLLRKRVSNEILFGYSGDVYFYAWVRERKLIATAPFGAIKDVSILSAQVGNAVTIAFLAVAWCLLPTLHLTRYASAVLFAGAGVALTMLPVILFHDRIFSLPQKQLRQVALIQFVRVAATPFLNAWVWHEAVPAIDLSVWLALAAMRQLLSRIPFMPGKDLVFAGMAAWMIGTDNGIVAAIALCGTLVLLFDLAIGVVLGLADVLLPDPVERSSRAARLRG